MNARYIINRQGFTIVELLIVIVVIAILAAITIVSFNGVQKRAQTSSASSTVRQVVQKIELYRAENTTNPTSLSLIGITSKQGDATVQYTALPEYCVTARVSSISYYQSSATTAPAEGVCPDHTLGPNPQNPVPTGLVSIRSTPGSITAQGTIVFVGTSAGGSYRYIVDQRPSGSLHRLVLPNGESNGTFGAYSQSGTKYTLTGEYTGDVWIGTRFNNAEQWNGTFRSAHYNRALSPSEKTKVVQYLSSLVFEN